MGARLVCQLANGSGISLVASSTGPLLARRALHRSARPGTLIVKPERHVTSVADLTGGRGGGAWTAPGAGVSGRQPARRRRSGLQLPLVACGGEPVHVHYVVQPVTMAQMSELGAYGPDLQVAMFRGRGMHPTPPRWSVSPDVSRLHLAGRPCPARLDVDPMASSFPQSSRKAVASGSSTPGSRGGGR